MTVIDADRLAAVWLRARAAERADFDDRFAAADAAAPAPPAAAHARDITDDEFLIAVASVATMDGRIWATFYDLEPAFGGTPWKVLRAKLARVMRRDLVTGCDCGCRGDIELLAAGRERLREIAAALAAAGVHLPGATPELTDGAR